MNQDIKAKWVEALRSGKYAQGMRCLRDASTDTYCCLGVLCEIAVEEGVIDEPVFSPVCDAYSYGDPDRRDAYLLPPAVFRWSGLGCPSPVLDNNEPLSGLNDNGVSFEHIADRIEAEL